MNVLIPYMLDHLVYLILPTGGEWLGLASEGKCLCTACAEHFYCACPAYGLRLRCIYAVFVSVCLR